MNILMHVDFNAFFASVEQQANPFLRNRAIGVGGKSDKPSVVTTASYKAKNRGVKTAMSVWEAQRICPELLMVNGDPRKYSQMTDRLLAILERYASRVAQTSIDEAYIDVTDAAQDWMGAVGIALCIRQAVAKEIGPHVGVSIGIASNTLVAKMASGAEKPNGLTLVRPEDQEAFLDTRSLADIPGIGPRIVRRLKGLGIFSVLQLRTYPLPTLIHHFKQYGTFLYTAARGQGQTEVYEDTGPPKSISHCYTLPHHDRDIATVRATYVLLCENVAWRLRKHQLSARACVITLRSDALTFTSHHRILDALTQDGLTLFHEAWPIVAAQHEQGPVRLIGITAIQLVTAHTQQPTEQKQQKRTRLLPALDTLRRRYGTDAWKPLSALSSTPLHERASGFHFDHQI